MGLMCTRLRQGALCFSLGLSGLERPGLLGTLTGMLRPMRPVMHCCRRPGLVILVPISEHHALNGPGRLASLCFGRPPG